MSLPYWEVTCLMLSKLAFRNVKNSYKDFSIFFLTLTFSVALFYTFNSFGQQQVMLNVSAMQKTMLETLELMMGIISVVVAVVCAFLILYANSFLIKRRKKELGIYMLLGMNESKISKIILIETVFIGIFSLISGLLLGYIISQFVVFLTASILAVTVDYRFVFSAQATSYTVVSYLIIFLVVMIFNTGNIRRFKLIDLLNAGRKNQELKLKSPIISMLLFVVSLGILGFTYWVGLEKGVSELLQIVITGSIGTFLFFFSLSGFMLQFLKGRKKLYYRNLNMFTLRQIHSNINHNFMSISTICLMLLLSIGALTTGFSLNKALEAIITPMKKYQISVQHTTIAGEQYDINNMLNIDESQIEYELNYTEYYCDVKYEELMALINDPTIIVDPGYDGLPIYVVPLSHQNKMHEAYGIMPIELEKGHFMILTRSGYLEIAEYLNLLEGGISVFEEELTYGGGILQSENVRAGLIYYLGINIIVNDEDIPAGTTGMAYVSYNLVNEDQEQAIADSINKAAHVSNQNVGETFFFGSGGFGEDVSYAATSREIKEMMVSVVLIFTYVGLYLGVIFVISSVVVLALQQLSQANENQNRYMVLTKIGASKKMMDRSILLQIVIYFVMPLILAIVHAVFGVKVVLDVFEFELGIRGLIQPALLCAGVIAVIYFGYFIVTVQSSKRIAYNRTN